MNQSRVLQVCQRFLATVMVMSVSVILGHGYAQGDRVADVQEINAAISEWDHAWETKDVELAIKSYATDTDWTNAFGARVQSREALRELLTMIFGFDFVMTGKNNYGENEITFLSDSIATVRSQNIRKGQKWPDGTEMGDREINHLRVFKLIDGEWLITDHMISQAWPKEMSDE